MIFNEDKLQEEIIKTWGEFGVHNEVFKAMKKQISDLKQLTLTDVGCSLPSKERVTDQANSYAENFNRTEINLIKKQAFVAGVNWILLCYCNEVR